MEVRDKIGTVESYSVLIQKKMKSLENDRKHIEYVMEKEKEGEQAYSIPNYQVLTNFKISDIGLRLKILLATYSMGEDIEKVREQYPAIVSLISDTWEEVTYVPMIQMLSIGILININNVEFDKLVEVVKKDKEHDFLIDFLIHYREPDWHITMDSFMYPTPYQCIQDIVFLAKTAKEAAVSTLRKYLTKQWYRGHSDEGWYNIHKTSINLHQGYWSFESGALVKILGLDDSGLKGLQYYPYDMVHWSDSK